VSILALRMIRPLRTLLTLRWTAIDIIQYLTLQLECRFGRKPTHGGRVLGDVIGPGDVTDDEPMHGAVHLDVVLVVRKYRLAGLEPLDLDVRSRQLALEGRRAR